MNRWMLAIVGLLVVAGFAIFLTNGPSMIDRIRATESCAELGALFVEVKEDAGQSLNRELQRQAIALGC
jgi:hypothetical protein